MRLAKDNRNLGGFCAFWMGQNNKDVTVIALNQDRIDFAIRIKELKEHVEIFFGNGDKPNLFGLKISLKLDVGLKVDHGFLKKIGCRAL